MPLRKPARVEILLLDVVALFLLTMSATLVVDFTRRLLGTDPDTLGIASIAVQAALTVAASSAFTKTGLELLKKALGHDVTKESQWRFGLSLALFLIVIFSWLVLLPRLAQHYNTRAFHLNQTLTAQNAPPSAIVGKPNDTALHGKADVLRDYQRAVALDPTLYMAYTNVGTLLEGFYRYDEAADQYRKAILAQPAGKIDIVAYSDLARSLILSGKPTDALRVIQDALRATQIDSDSLSALYHNKAWAEYDLGFYTDALADAARSAAALNTAAATCITAKADTKLGRSTDAAVAWKQFRAQYASNAPSSRTIEPDCVLLSEVPDEKK